MPRCNVCETNLPNAYGGLGYFNDGSSWACEPCRGVMRKENKGQECLMCRWRVADTGSYESVVCSECSQHRTGRGQESDYTMTDCGACGNELLSVELMRCSGCGDSMCGECPGDTQYCVGCRKDAETFEAPERRGVQRELFSPILRQPLWTYEELGSASGYPPVWVIKYDTTIMFDLPKEEESEGYWDERAIESLVRRLNQAQSSTIQQLFQHISNKALAYPNELYYAEGKVRTMSGKPHTPRKLKKDKDITPKEAAKRMKLEAESGQMCEVCHVNDDLPYDADHFKECRRCSKSVCLECWDEMEHDEKFGIVCGSCWVVLDNVAQFGADDNPLWRADALWYNLVYGSRMGFLELHMGEMNLPLMVRMGKMKMPESIEELSKAIHETPKSTARLLANYAEHNGWITVDMRNGIVEGAGFKAEEFGAESRESSTLPCYCERCDNYTDLDGKGWILLSGELLCPNCESKESSTLPLVCEQCDNYEDLEGEGWSLLSGELLCPNCGLKEYKSEANEEGTFYNDGRIAAGIVFMPDMKDRESFGLMDAEYAFTFGLSPDELVSEIDNNSKRYTQFSWGWGQEWDKLNMDTILNPETFNGEMMGEKPFQEYIPDISDFKSSMILVGGLLVGLLGYNKVIDSKKAETFNASEACSEDTDCPEGKVCVDGKCLPICVDDGDCASWQECRDDLHPTEKVCGEDKNDSNGNPFTDIFNKGDKDVENPNDAPKENSKTYSTTEKALISIGMVGAIGISLKVLGGIHDKESGE